jgi:hemerythrin-like domain-containing protein
VEEIKPIKRSKELAPLSREHHDGLLFVWKIRQGLANNTSVETLRNFTLWFWTNHIKPHFKEEEKVLVKFLPIDNPLVQQMINEHEQIRDIIVSLDQRPTTSSFELLAEFLNKHIRFEERQLFAYAEEVLSPEQLNLVYLELAHEPHCKIDAPGTAWKDEFWVKK